MVITNVNQVVYQGDGVTTAFPFTFRIIDATDVKLLLIDADGTETDITSDYFVDINTNTVHYPGYAPGSEPAEADQPAPVQTGQKLMIYRKLPITQEKDLGDKWPFYVIELGLDKLTMILQDIWDWCGRCLQVSRGQAADAGDDFDPTIPLEAGKVVIGNDAGTGFSSAKALLYENDGWNAEGQSISNVATPGKVKDATTKEYVDNLIDKLSVEADRYVVFNTVAAMKAADLPAGYNTRTLGYHDINDGGAGVYSIRGKVDGETEDGGSVIFLENGNVAVLITDGTVFPEQFGAKGDGTTDDLTSIQKAIDFGETVVFSKTYMISAGILLHSNLNIVGNNKGKIVKDPATTTHFSALYWYDTNNTLGNVTIKGLSIEGLKHWTGVTISGTANDFGIRLWNTNNVKVEGCNVSECGGCAISVNGTNVKIEKNIVAYTGTFTGNPPNYNFGISYGGENYIISRNTISGVIQGIISGLTNKRVRIVNNDITTNGQHGLYMEGGDNVVVANNNIHDVSIAGVKFQKQDTSVFGDIVIDGNTIVNCGGQGVFVVNLSSATNSIERVSITNNVIDKCVRCIDVQKVQQVDIVNNVLYATTTNGYGIRALTIDFANIVGNTIKTDNVLAIICSSDTTGTQINRSVLIAHNNIYITSSALVGSVFGIEVAICNGMMIDGNIVTHDGTNTSMDGIYIHGASISKAYLTNNVVSGFRWDLRGVNLAEGAVTLGTNYYTTKTGL